MEFPRNIQRALAYNPYIEMNTTNNLHIIPTIPTPPQRINYSKIDDFNALVESPQGWNIEFLQLDSGPFQAKISQYLIPEVNLLWIQCNRKLEQRSIAPEGMLTFGIPLTEDFNLDWKGQRVTGNDILIFPQNTEMTFYSDQRYAMCVLSISEQTLSDQAKSWGMLNILESISNKEVIHLHPGSSNRLRHNYLTVFDILTRHDDTFESGEFDSLIREDLALEVFHAIAKALHTPPTSEPEHTQSLRRVLDAIEDKAHDALTVQQLCQLTGCSERTLQCAFHDKFGISPKSYIQAYRLNHVRKLLRKAPVKRGQITDIANQWGFWHMGQFAKDYRRFFGELPRVTLAHTP